MNSTVVGFTHLSFFLNYWTQIVVMKCEGIHGRFLINYIFASIAVLYLEFFNTKEFNKRVFKMLFRRKRDAIYLIRKKFFLHVSTLSNSCSNSDVHLTVGYLLPKPLNSSEAEGYLIIRNLLPLMCGCFCLWYFPSINQNKVVLLKDLATEHITVNYLMAISIFLC